MDPANAINRRAKTERGVNEEMFGAITSDCIVTHFTVFILTELQAEVIALGELQVQENLFEQITALGSFLYE